jgi:2-haloacid dehalogenase
VSNFSNTLLDCYPEVLEILIRLKSHGMLTALLSNGSPTMLKSAVESAALGELIDTILSVADVGVYKPHPHVYQLAVDKRGLPLRTSVFSRLMPGIQPVQQALVSR